MFDPLQKKFLPQGKISNFSSLKFQENPSSGSRTTADLREKNQYFGEAKASKLNYVISEVLMIVYEKQKHFTCSR